MKVLVTGVTPQQTGSAVMIGYVGITEYMRMGLDEVGIEWDHRKVQPGEDLDEYDAFLVGLAPIRGNVARHTYGMLWTLRRARETGKRVVLYVDDWQYPKIKREIVGQHRRMTETFFNDHKPKCRAYWDDALRLRKELEDELSLLAEGLDAGSPVHPAFERAVYPGWSWGDPEIVQRDFPAHELGVFDPGSWAYDLVLRKYGEIIAGNLDLLDITQDARLKNETWVLAALSDQNSWQKRQKLEWPVLGYGTKLPLGKVKETVIYEENLRNWGVLSPGYKHAGSGWWRVRAFDAVIAGSVWQGDLKAEMATMGDESWLMKAGDVEKMNWRDRADLSSAQHQSLKSRLQSRADAGDVLKKLLV